MGGVMRCAGTGCKGVVCSRRGMRRLLGLAWDEARLRCPCALRQIGKGCAAGCCHTSATEPLQPQHDPGAALMSACGLFVTKG